MRAGALRCIRTCIANASGGGIARSSELPRLAAPILWNLPAGTRPLSSSVGVREPAVPTRDPDLLPPQRPRVLQKEDKCGPALGDVDLANKAAFAAAWRKLETRLGPQGLTAPRELIFLNGAPGSGKGTQLPLILRNRGLSRNIGMSSLLLDDPEAKRTMDRGLLVSDEVILDLLLEKLFDPAKGADNIGAIVDGFPRSAKQVDFLRLLHAQLKDLHRRHADHPVLRNNYPRPLFIVVVLYVDEEESVRRQMIRGQLTARLKDAGIHGDNGEVSEIRVSDTDEGTARRRFQLFKLHYSALMRLRDSFPFHLIDAMCTVQECEEKIGNELRYQSSLELSEKTYQAICHIPVAQVLVHESRQQLVARLDDYGRTKMHLLQDVVAHIDEEVIPLLRRCALAGHSVYTTTDPLFLTAISVDMLIDVLSDRGFAVDYQRAEQHIPRKIDAATGKVECEVRYVHTFSMTFERALLRGGEFKAPPTAAARPALPRPEARASRSATSAMAVSHLAFRGYDIPWEDSIVEDQAMHASHWEKWEAPKTTTSSQPVASRQTAQGGGGLLQQEQQPPARGLRPSAPLLPPPPPLAPAAAAEPASYIPFPAGGGDNEEDDSDVVVLQSGGAGRGSRS